LQWPFAKRAASISPSPIPAFFNPKKGEVSLANECVPPFRYRGFDELDGAVSGSWLNLSV